MSSTRARILLVAILAVYLILGTLYAVYTPAWQAPDEPAHYNYVRYVAENGTFPVLEQGDYSQGYLDQIKDRKFPPDMPVDRIRYEFHQPPLYYALAAPVYNLFKGVQGPWATPAAGLLPLRLLSVLLGLPLIVLAYATGRRIYPAWPALGLGTAAFVAFLPRHAASAAQVGNDILAEALLAGVVVVLVDWLLEPGGHGGTAPTRPVGRLGGTRGRVLLLGALLGLIAITKTTAYFAAALVVGVMIWEWRKERAGVGRIARDVALLAAPAALLALPWYGRDIAVYGWPDFLGLGRHALVVAGQLRTVDYLAEIGLGAYLQRLTVVTFESFWAVFGWMGVFLDVRIYEALAVLCAAVAGGLALHERQVRGPRRVGPGGADALSQGQRRALRLLAATALLALLVYAWYNYQFVQFQGRYLFTALIPVAVAFGLGWDAATRPAGHARILAAGLAALAIVIAIAGVASGGGLPKWPVALALAGAGFFAAASLLPQRYHGILFALPYAALPALAVYALFGGIVAQL